MKIDFSISFIMITLFILIMLFLSVRGVMNSTKNIKSIQESKSFRKTIGTISDVSLWFIIEESNQTDDIPLFKVVKTYKYQVNGRDYTNNKTQLFDDDLLKNYKPISELEPYNKWVLNSDNYKEAISKINSEKLKTIPVFYKKQKPEISCLRVDIDNSSILKLVLNILLLVIASVASFFFLKKYFL